MGIIQCLDRTCLRMRKLIGQASQQRPVAARIVSSPQRRGNLRRAEGQRQGNNLASLKDGVIGTQRKRELDIRDGGRDRTCIVACSRRRHCEQNINPDELETLL
jgi:hypothetical protein